MQRWKVILRYGLVFMLGLVLGMAGSRLAHKHRLAQVMQNRPVAQRRMMMRHLTRQLQLTKPQQIEIERIVDAQLKALSDVRERHQPEVQAIFQQAEDKMKPHLLSEQQQKLDQIMQRMQKRRPMHGRRPPPL
ncbi:MAG: YqiA/YcfP family alpha/beta fold hydrolase [Verrucomicrobiota bacterium]